MFNRIENIFGSKKTDRKSIRKNSVKLNLEPLEERWCPSTTWTDNNHAYDDYWTDAGNWSNGLPGTGNAPVFDGNVTNNTCIVNTNTPTSMALTIQNGFHGTLQVQPGDTLGFGNFTDSDPSSDSFNVEYGTNGSSGGSMDITGTAHFYNLNISDTVPSAPKGYTTIASTATVSMGDGSGWSINVVDEIDDDGEWYIGASNGGEASTVYANAIVEKPWQINGSLTIKGSTSLNYKDAVSAGYTYIWVNLGSNLTLYGGAGQEIDMPVYVNLGTMSVDTGFWTFKGTLPALGQAHVDTIFMDGGTFNLGEPTTNLQNASVFYDQSFEMGKANSNAGTLNIWGPNNVSDSDYLIGISTTSSNYFTYGTINFNGYGQILTVGTTQIGGGAGGNGIVLNMFAAGTGGGQDKIVSENTFGSGDVVIAANSTLKTKVAPGDSATKGTFTLIDESAGADKMKADFTTRNLFPLTATHTVLSNANQSYYWTYTVP